ncbi:MAG: cobalt transporter CbiM, partial [Merismopedia sp. SIO2A8]|nr:cobalt transporter CbiM [Merismopedia sp. SIO2A8]
MHIPDGILPASVCIAGYAATGGLIWYSLRRIHRSQNSQQNIPKASLLTAAFFIASWIHIPVPPASVHLILNGLLGTILGYYALPAIVIGLFFQAVMFQHGGLSTL